MRRAQGLSTGDTWQWLSTMAGHPWERQGEEGKKERQKIEAKIKLSFRLLSNLIIQIHIIALSFSLTTLNLRTQIS